MPDCLRSEPGAETLKAPHMELCITVTTKFCALDLAQSGRYFA